MLGFQIKNQETGRCLKGQGSNNGTNIATAYCSSNDNSQRWDFLADDDGGGYNKIIAKHSGKCLDVYGGSKDNGANIIQWPCHGRDNQKFRLETQGLSYEYFEGSWSSLPDFDSLTHVKSGEVANFDILVRNRNDNFYVFIVFHKTFATISC